jgi:hypothetical protein
MVHPTVMQQLARERAREDLELAQTRGVGFHLSHRPFRERLGWSLVNLGTRLTRDPLAGGTMHGRNAQGGKRARAHSVLPLARM